MALDRTHNVVREAWIGVDFDGTLAHYDHWRGELDFGKPIPKMVERIKHWLFKGYKVKIFTARVSLYANAGFLPDLEDVQRVERIKKALGDWSELHIGERLEVTNVKDFDMIELYDDRAVQVEKNTGELVGKSTRGLE